MDRFLKLVRWEDSELLRYMIRKDHNALILLTVIALRARRVKDPHPATGRKQFEAEIGDPEVCGLTAQQYRTAKKHLEKWGLVTLRGTSRGTVATLCNGEVFDINPEEGNEPANKPSTNGQRSDNEPATTKKNDKNGNNGKNESSASGDAAIASSSLADSYCGLSGERLKRFNQFWEAFNYRKGKAGAAKSWGNIGVMSDELLQLILAGAAREAKKRNKLIDQGSIPKMAQGWLTDRRWEDEQGEGKQQHDRMTKFKNDF